MTNQQLIELTKQLIAIESTVADTYNLHRAFNFIVHMLEESGKDITIEKFESNDRPSFIAYRGNKRPDNFRIILNTHLDVVPGQPEQFKAKVKDGKLYGRGTHDEKAAAVILADLFCEFVDKVPYPLGLQVVTDEESGGFDGARYQIEQGVRADFVICAECGRRTDVHEIANEAKGIVIADISFKGNASHAAYPWRGDNAATKAADFIMSVHKRYPAPVEESSTTTMTVTSVSAAGGAHTRIPDSAAVRLDIRYTPDDPNFRSRSHFAALIEEMDPNAIVDILVFDSPLYSSPKNPLLKSLKKCAEEVEGAKFSFVRRHATSDGRHYGDVGDQACEFGIAGEDQHGDDEHVTLEAFSNYRKTMQRFLTKTISSEKDATHTKAFGKKTRTTLIDVAALPKGDNIVSTVVDFAPKLTSKSPK